MEGYRRSVQVVAGLLAGAIFLAACSDDDNRRRRSRDDDGGEGGESANPSGGTSSGGVAGRAGVAGSAGSVGTSGSTGISGSSSSGGSDGSGGTSAGTSSAGSGAAGSGTSGSDGSGGTGASAGTDGSGGTGATSGGSTGAGGSSSGEGGTSGSGGTGPDLSELPEACELLTTCGDCCETVGVFSLDAESLDRTLEGVTQWSYDGSSVNANFTFSGPNQVGAIFFRLTEPAEIEYLDLYAGGSGGGLEVVLVNDGGTNGCIYPIVDGTLLGYSSCWGTGAGPAFGVPVDQIDVRIFSTASGPGYLEVLELGFSGLESGA